jgi:hypothetical protein
MKNTIVIILLILITATGYCQRTIKTKLQDAEATIFIDKDYRSRPYKKIIVYTGITNAKDNGKIFAELKDLGTLVNSIDLFPPVKEYTEEETKKIYADNGIDGVIKIEVKKSEMQAMASRKTDFDVTLTDLITNANAAKFICVGYLGYLNSGTNENKAIVKGISLIADELKRLILN